MRIRWTRAAADDLPSIRDYLAGRDSHLAQPTVRKLYQIARSLKTFPLRGRAGREEGTRELVCAPLPFIIVYRVQGGDVQTLHIHHSAQHR
jgi:toxin ParE1/3/4